jgi:hypothetical protein
VPCRDPDEHRRCSGSWRGVVSLGYGPDGKRIRRKVRGQTRTEVRDKLRDLRSDNAAGIRKQEAVTVQEAAQDWLALARAGARGASAASALTSRGTTTPEATGPHSFGRARSTATSGRQSPPSASATTRSVRILPGSCTAHGARHQPRPAAKPRLSPVTPAPGVSPDAASLLPASWRLPGPDFHRQATTSLRAQDPPWHYVTVSPPVLRSAGRTKRQG